MNTWFVFIHRLVRGFLAVLALLLAPTLSAATFVVNTTADSVDSNNGITSLRDAITGANTAGGANTITFDSTVFTSATSQTITLTGALPNISSNLTITGPGAKLATVSGQGSGTPFRIFRITSGNAVSISGLAMANGYAAGANGGASVAGTTGSGGAIYTSGSLALTDCWLNGNHAVGGTGGAGANDTKNPGGAGADGFGGAVYSDGTALIINRCTFSSNSAQGGSGGTGGQVVNTTNGGGVGGNAGNAWGGGIYMASGSASIINSTFFENTANGGSGGAGGATNFGGGEAAGGTGGNSQGGAIFSTASATVRMISCTVTGGGVQPGNGGLQNNFSGNATPGTAHGGGVMASGIDTIGNTLIAANTQIVLPAFTTNESDVAGTYSSLNYNLIGAPESGATGINGAEDLQGTVGSPLNAKMDPNGLRDNGGPTPTVRIVRGTPAVDKGKDLSGAGTDQRLLPRPVDLPNGSFPNAVGGDGSDIGAFESQTTPNSQPDVTAVTISAHQGVGLSGQTVAGSANDFDSDPLTFLVASGTLPSGIKLNSDGTVTGTATTAGKFVVEYEANDGIENSFPATLEIDVAEAASLVVTTDQDVVNQFDGLTSLREALTAATNSGTGGAITFDPAFFAARRTISLLSSNGGLSAFISGTINITAPAAGVIISGSGQTSIFAFGSGQENLTNLSLVNGKANPFSSAGALAVFSGTVSLTGCTLSGNGGSGGNVLGGAVSIGSGLLNLTNCTLSGNFATGANSGGGAIYNGGGSVKLLDCTVSGNNAASGTGSGILVTSGTVTMGNTLVAGNTSTSVTDPDISGTIASLGYNLIGNTTGVTVAGTTTGNLTNVNPGLDPDGLGSNGGPTETIALTATSVAIDAGKAFGVTTDQRGDPRPFDEPGVTNAAGGDGSDIGAYEEQAPEPAIAVQQPAGTDLISQVSSVSFGSAVEAGTTVPLVFTIKDKGSLPLNLTGSTPVTISGSNASEFVVTSEPGSSTLASGSSTSFTVKFAPVSPGAKTATLAVASNDPNQDPFTVTISGSAKETVTQAPALISPASNSDVSAMVSVTFSLPETALPNSVTLTFNNGTQFPFAVGAADETAGTHNVTLDTVGSGMAPGIYSLTLAYQNLVGDPVAAVTHTNINIRPANPTSAVFLRESGTAPGAGGASGLPANAILASFGVPATDDAGDIAYLADWSGGRVRGRGIFLNSECVAIAGGTASGIAGAKYSVFDAPVVDSGKIAFIAFMSGSRVPRSAVFSTIASGSAVPIAEAGAVAPDETGAQASGGAVFKSFSAVAVEGTSVAIYAELTGGTGTFKATSVNHLGLWVKNGSNPLKLVIRQGDLVDGETISSLASFGVGAGSPGQGRGWLTTPSGPQVQVLATFHDKAQAILSGTVGGQPVIVSLSGTTGDGGPSIPGAKFATYGFPAFNDSNQSTFLGTLAVSGTTITKADSRGIFIQLSGSTYEPLVRIGDLADPATPSTSPTFKLLKDPVLSSNGTIAFQATLAGKTIRGLEASTIWWLSTSGNLALLAQGGTQAADLATGAEWNKFTSLAIASGGRGPIFEATLVPNRGGVTAAIAKGVWGCDISGTPRLLFRTGDTIGGKTLKSFSLLTASPGSVGVTRSFNDAGGVVWLATFTDKTQAIVVTELP